MKKLHEYTGCIHIHSSFSDGTGGLKRIVEPAQTLGLDFLVLTDHMTLKAREEGWERYYKNVLLLTGYEHHDPRGRNHYLVLGEKCRVLPADLEPAAYIMEAKKDEAIGFIAHPVEKRKAIASLPPYPWEDWDIKGFDGIEIWNQLSDWVEQVTPYNLAFRIFFPRRFLNPPPAELLEKWDRLTQSRTVSAIGGVDAHEHQYRFGPLRYTLISYKVSYKSIRTHLLIPEQLTGDHNNDRKIILTALRKGQSYISNYRVGDSRGFRFWCDGPENQFYGPGKEAGWEKGLTARVSLPERADIVIIRNGKTVFNATGNSAEYPLEYPGVYRVEVKKKGKEWIYTNPVYLRAI